MPRTTETIPASKGRATIIAFAPRPPQIPTLQYQTSAAELAAKILQIRALHPEAADMIELLIGEALELCAD